jgi:ABC-type transport system involved in multi-copper enzyme maturation permease subunit
MAIDAELNNTGVAALSLLLFMFTMSFGSMGFMFSAFYSDRGKAVFTVVGILIFSYALDVLANFNDFIEKLDFLSLFKYYDPYPYISTASIDWSDLAVYAGIIIITSTVAIIRFQRRDIAV